MCVDENNTEERGASGSGWPASLGFFYLNFSVLLPISNPCQMSKFYMNHAKFFIISNNLQNNDTYYSSA